MTGYPINLGNSQMPRHSNSQLMLTASPRLYQSGMPAQSMYVTEGHMMPGAANLPDSSGMLMTSGVLVPQGQSAMLNDMQHYIHVPVFRKKKRIYVKRQAEGCCGCLNSWGYCDAPGGFAVFPYCNVAGCLDREKCLRVDSFGNPVQKKKTFKHPC